MITIYESERLCQLIRDKNNRKELYTNNHKLSFDEKGQKIILTDVPIRKYLGGIEDLDILPRLISKYEDNKSFEPHLQAYIVKNIGKGINKSLDECIMGKTSDFEWLGNEVSCGVGMQRIDIMISMMAKDQRVLVPIELKAVEADIINVKQTQRYIDWIEQYYTPNRQGDIQPVLLSKAINDKTSKKYQEIIDSFNGFNTKNTSRCHNLKYVEYNLENNDLLFKTINY